MEEKKIIELQKFRRIEGDDWAANAQEFADQVAKGEITHGVMIYRDQEGRVHWRIFNEESSTYVLGLLSRLEYIINSGGVEE